ncbi:MAG: Sialic acid transporter NanT [Chlamydiae bacterium]|nr:Sialic acid transporter NanT [Chlamydiota bacterium]
MRWIIWAFAATFYFYEYLLRVSPSTMVPELMNGFSLNASEIGALGGAFFLAYAPMQVPVGLLMDRFGARKLLTYASIGCGIGSILFGISKGITLLYIGRILIGAGASFAFVAMVFVCSHWFEKSKRALLVGLANSIAMLGGLVGEGPLSSFVHQIGWRWVMIILGFVGLGLALLIFLTLLNKDPSSNSIEEAVTHNGESFGVFKSIGILIKSWQTWLNSAVALLYYMSTSALTGLWGIAFIQTGYGVNKVIAGYAISMLFVGWLVGGPLMGAISDRIGNRKWVINSSILLTLLSLLPILYWTSIPLVWVYVLLFCVGLFSSAQLLNFTFSTEINPHQIKGFAIACTNFIVAVGSAFILPIIGIFLDSASKGSQLAQHSYSAQAYKCALTILPLCLVLAWLLTFFLNEGKRNQHASHQDPMN